MLNADNARRLGDFLAALDKISRETRVEIEHYEGVQLAVGEDGGTVRLRSRRVESHDAIEYYAQEEA